MLPTTGFFKDIECPYYEKSCVRPYCHFRHRKRSQEPPEESPPLPPDEPIEIPTYKPTPKSELANTKSHIPISYVPDLVIRSDRNLRPIPSFNLADRPTYKPTPISILSSTNVSKVCEYTPTSVVLDDSKDDINLEELTTEFDLIDEILEDNDSKKGKRDKKEKSSPKDKKRDKEKSKSKESDKVKDKEKSSNKEKEVKHRKDKYSSSSGSKGKHKERDKDKDSESEEIKQNKDNKKHKDKECEDVKNKDRRSKEKEEVKHKEKEQDTKSKDNKRDKDKIKEKGRDRDKEKLRERDKEKESNSDREKDKIKDPSDKHKSKDRKEKEQIHIDKDKNKERKEKEQIHIDKEKSKDRKEKEQIHIERDKNKDRKNHNDKDRNKERKEKEQNFFGKEKSQNHSDKERNKDRGRVKSKDKDRREKDKKREKHEKAKKGKEPEKQEAIMEWNLTDDFESDVNFMLDEEDDEMDSIEAECYKIFNEYTPPIMEEKYEPMPTEPSDIVPEPYNPTCKKRIAYENANQSSSKIVYNKPKPVTNMSLIMLNRLKQARQAQADNNHRDLLAELNKPSLKRAPEVESSSNKRFAGIVNGKPKPSVPSLPKPNKPVSLVDEILGGRSANKPRRIAPVQNVNLIQRAKAQFDAMVKTKAANVFKTQAQTTGKGNKRVAHVPDASLSDIPDVLHSERSKLPVNVRTRYLTMLADECVKLYLFKDDAYQRALNEELKCYEKCSVLTTYRNSAMLAVNRLRKESQEREKEGLGPIQPGEDDGRVVDSPLQGKRFYESVQNFVLTEDELVLHGYPREGPEPGRAIITSDSRVVSDNLDENQRICCRCHKLYLVDDDGLPLVSEDCVYHPLRKRTLRGERTYLCCKSTDDAGCAMSNTHVSEVSADRELEGYQSTLEPEYADDPRNYAVYALDCEMCYTTIGLELTRVTIVDTNLKTVYESLVKPLNPIIDYNTRFSGITEDQMDRTSTSILQVQANILHLCNSKTLLIGHSLESDMKALKIIHSNIIDTSVMFPHKFGLPHKRALRVLASEYLRKIIQNGTDGHDSAEDALTCMELVVWKVKEDMKVKGVKG